MRDGDASPVMSHLRLLGTGSGPLRPACYSTTWIWNVHADAHDFRSYSDNFAIVSRQIFATHFGHVSLILLWMSGMFFSGARFSNYEAWLKDPLHIKPSSQIVWTVVNQDILNEDVGGGLTAIRITSGLFHVWRSCGLLTETELFATAIGALLVALLMVWAGWFHFHQSVPTGSWFNNVDSLLNHHLTGLLGCG